MKKTWTIDVRNLSASRQIRYFGTQLGAVRKTRQIARETAADLDVWLFLGAAESMASEATLKLKGEAR